MNSEVQKTLESTRDSWWGSSPKNITSNISKLYQDFYEVQALHVEKILRQSTPLSSIGDIKEEIMLEIDSKCNTFIKQLLAQLQDTHRLKNIAEESISQLRMEVQHKNDELLACQRQISLQQSLFKQELASLNSHFDEVVSDKTSRSDSAAVQVAFVNDLKKQLQQLSLTYVASQGESIKYRENLRTLQKELKGQNKLISEYQKMMDSQDQKIASLTNQSALFEEAAQVSKTQLSALLIQYANLAHQKQQLQGVLDTELASSKRAKSFLQFASAELDETLSLQLRAQRAEYLHQKQTAQNKELLVQSEEARLRQIDLTAEKERICLEEKKKAQQAIKNSLSLVAQVKQKGDQKLKLTQKMLVRELNQMRQANEQLKNWAKKELLLAARLCERQIVGAIDRSGKHF